MSEDFKKAMLHVHTWTGLVLGPLLLAIFWMGTLSVFDREIDRWMWPQSRVALEEPVSLDALRPAIDAAAGAADAWFYILPSEREPVGRLFYTVEGERVLAGIDPLAREALRRETLAGTGFIFPFHYSLHLKWQQLGYWLVGAAGMAMLLALTTGLLIHARILRDFFTLRVFRGGHVAKLDTHTVVGVLTLPFCLLITLSGLIIFFHIYFPQAVQTVYAQRDAPRAAFFADVFGGYDREAAGEPAPRRASIDAMVERARAAWDGAEPWAVAVTHRDDRNGFVMVRRDYPDSVTRGRDMIWYDLVTGEELHRFSEAPVKTAQSWFLGFHFIQFDHWTLRWLYFAGGLGGCVVIATGFLYWLAKRRKRWQAGDVPGFRLVEGLAIGSVTGIVIATLAFFVSNRLLPLGANFAGYERAALEVWAFYLVWLATFAHAWLRPAARAWREQCLAIAALALLAPVLNGVTTGDHLLKTLAEGYWPVAGMDLLLLAGAGLAIYAARKLARAPSEHAAAPDTQHPASGHV